jgi:hypothetical protein
MAKLYHFLQNLHSSSRIPNSTPAKKQYINCN